MEYKFSVCSKLPTAKDYAYCDQNKTLKCCEENQVKCIRDIIHANPNNFNYCLSLNQRFDDITLLGRDKLLSCCNNENYRSPIRINQTIYLFNSTLTFEAWNSEQLHFKSCVKC